MGYVGPEHVLLALGRDAESQAGRLLQPIGITHTKLRGAVIRGVEAGGAAETSKTPKLDEYGSRRLGRRLHAQRIEVEFSDDAVHLLAQEGFDPEFGARPLRRTIQRLVENELSRLVLSGEVEPGDRVVVDAERGLHFEVESGGASIGRGAEEAEREPAGTAAQRR